MKKFFGEIGKIGGSFLKYVVVFILLLLLCFFLFLWVLIGLLTIIILKLLYNFSFKGKIKAYLENVFRRKKEEYEAVRLNDV